MGTDAQDNNLFEQVLPLFNAMGDKNRQQIILLLAHHNILSVGELASHTHLSRPAVSHHLKVLKDAELVTEKREGVRRYYHPTFDKYIQPMREILDYAEQGNYNKKGDDCGK